LIIDLFRAELIQAVQAGVNHMPVRISQTRHQGPPTAVDDVDLDLLLIRPGLLIDGINGVTLGATQGNRLLRDATRFRVDFVGAGGRNVLADPPDQVADHEHILALQQLFARTVEDVDVLEERHFRWYLRCDSRKSKGEEQ